MNAKSEVTKTIQYEKEYPDPRTLPAQPSWQQPRPQLTLSDLIPGEYVSATARVVHLKTSERKMLSEAKWYSPEYWKTPHSKFLLLVIGSHIH